MTRQWSPGSLDRCAVALSNSSEPGPATAADQPRPACTEFVARAQVPPAKIATGRRRAKPKGTGCSRATSRNPFWPKALIPCEAKKENWNEQSEPESWPAEPEPRPAEAGSAAAGRRPEAWSAVTAPQSGALSFAYRISSSE